MRWGTGGSEAGVWPSRAGVPKSAMGESAMPRATMARKTVDLAEAVTVGKAVDFLASWNVLCMGPEVEV